MINKFKNQFANWRTNLKESLSQTSRTTSLLMVAAACLLVISRFGSLGVVPPGSADYFLLRLLTAGASILSVILTILIIYKLTHEKKLALLTGFFLAISPWYIEQSRIYSPVLLGLTVLQSGVYAATYTKKQVLRLIIAGVSGILFFVVYPSFWLFQGAGFSPTPGDFLHNLFKLTSVDFLFYHNDSFWAGGFRTQGALLISCLPLFIAGSLSLLKNSKVSDLRLLIPFIIFWLLAASNPLFPEQREFFLVLPYVALILAFGTMFLLEKFKSQGLVVKTILTAFVFFFLYEHVLFFHWYTVHYSQRIKNERSYEMEKF